MRKALAGSACFLVSLLTGCTLSTTAPPTPQTGAAIHGIVHGGQQPVVGARVYLYAANTTGNAGNGLAAATSNTSISLLTSSVLTNNPSNSGKDSNNNYYVTSDANGDFSITSDYTCDDTERVYVYAVGGNPGAGANSAAGFLAILGSCPGPSFSSSLPIFVNEVSTIAAAYAFAGFATDPTHVSSDSAVGSNAFAYLAGTGVTNAFANAANLADLSSGSALATTPASNGGNGTVPQKTINTLANILAACINSTGPASSTCTTLLNTATSNGIPHGTAGAGTVPTDTAAAAINIAHYPGNNISSLFGITSASPPFAPALPTTPVPNDFTLGINFSLAGGGDSFPYGIAIDASGNAWITIPTGGSNFSGSVSKLSSTGRVLLGGDTNGSLNQPQGIAIDGDGYAWIANNAYGTTSGITKLSTTGSALLSADTNGGTSGVYGIAIDASGDAWITNNVVSGSVTKFSPTGAALLSSDGNGGQSYPQGIAIDGSGDAWIVNSGNSSVIKLSSTGAALLSDNANGGQNQNQFIAIDGSGNAWITNYGSDSSIDGGFGSVTKLSSTGAAASGTPFGGGGLNTPAGIAIDGSGNAWIANLNNSTITELSNSGSVLSPNGYTGGTINAPQSIAVDGSGNVWIANSGNVYVTELIGAATPVITPIAAGLPSTPTGDGSSNLGTRP